MVRARLCERIQAASKLYTRDFWQIFCWNIEQLYATTVRDTKFFFAVNVGPPPCYMCTTSCCAGLNFA